MLEVRCGGLFSDNGYPNTERNRSLAVTSNLFLHILPVKVRKQSLKVTYTFYLGSVALALFLILCGTGILLMFYYVPSIHHAYQDMQDLEFVVSSGLLFLRNLHRWSAHAMVLIVFLHLCRVFYTASYKPPREFNWVLGVVLFLLTLFLSFTGYLLRVGSRLAFWAITVGTNIARSVPVVGERLRFLLLGGNVVGQNALLRFYVLHVVVLPLVTTMFIAVHLWRIRKDGGLSVPTFESVEEMPVVITSEPDVTGDCPRGFLRKPMALWG